MFIGVGDDEAVQSLVLQHLAQFRESLPNCISVIIGAFDRAIELIHCLLMFYARIA